MKFYKGILYIAVLIIIAFVVGYFGYTGCNV